MVDDAQAARPHRVDGREVEPKRAVPRDVSELISWSPKRSVLIIFSCYVAYWETGSQLDSEKALCWRT